MSIYEGTFCRCCASDGPSRDLISTYNWMGEEEVYADMLRECFDITMETGEEEGICAVCITQLRNAFNFKKQVLHTEKQFRSKLLSKDKIIIPTVKLEVEQNKTSDSETDMLDTGADQDSDYEMPIKEEDEEDDPPEPPKKAKRPRRGALTATVTSKAKKVKKEGESSKSMRECKIKIEGGLELVPKKKGAERKPLMVADEKGLAKLTRIARAQPKSRKVKVKVPSLSMADKIKVIKVRSDASELEKQKRNLSLILENSNATPLEIYKSSKYRCVFCYCDFEKPTELKNHTLDQHDKKKLTFMDEHRTMRDFYVKMDVTDLRCTVCEEKLNLIDDLLQHLKTVHEKTVLNTLKKPIFQFDFSLEGFKCVFCSNIHSSLKALAEHQNLHFRYHVCDVCDQGYVTESKLSAHKYRHKTGVFKCEHCEQVFDSSWKRTDHNRKVHMARLCRFKCPYCPMKFAFYRERKAHSLTEHGKEIVPDIKCTACDKVFYHVTALSRHKRKDHLLERMHTCDVCSMSFFTKQMLIDHKIKHTGERLFQCVVCLKAYSRKKTLREHMRIHADERRFSCVHCGQQFVQKCSWKSHMRSKHDEVVE